MKATASPLSILGCCLLAGGSTVRAQSVQPTIAPRPKFEVASIRLCKTPDPRGKGGDGGGGNSSPERLSVNCQPVRNFIRLAYVANGRRNPLEQTPIEGGPGWIESDRYQISAKAEGAPGQEMMSGPMLRTLLEDRFRLKVHRETREVPVYSLIVAKSGPKLKPFQDGSCAPLDFSKPFRLPETPIPVCGLAMRKRNGLNLTWEVHGVDLDDLSKNLGEDLDRIVINKTAIAGRFDFHLEFAPDESTARLDSLQVSRGGPAFPQPGLPSDPSGAPSIFSAIQVQLGLKLEAAKGPREFLVIDSIERPSEN